jgi:hypothetical protein
MTTPNEGRLSGLPAGSEAPVWRPPKHAAEAPAPSQGFEPADAAPELTESDGPDPLEGRPSLEPLVPAIGGAKPLRARARGRRPTSTTILLAVSALVALGGIGFAVGRVTSSATSQTTTNGAQNGVPALDANASGAPGLGGDGQGGLGSGTATVSGTVVSVTADSITIQQADGQTVTVATGSSTSYHGQTSATGTDVTTGATVVVQTSGSAASPGTASASASPGAISRTATDVTITGK